MSNVSIDSSLHPTLLKGEGAAGVEKAFIIHFWDPLLIKGAHASWWFPSLILSCLNIIECAFSVCIMICKYSFIYSLCSWKPGIKMLTH